MKGYINNTLIDCDKLQISAYDLGLNRGYAVFDFFRIVEGCFRFLDDHLNRFMNSVKLSKIPITYTKQELLNKILDLQNINALNNGFVRITLTGGSSLNFSSISSSTLIILMGVLDANNKSDYSDGIKLLSKKHQRALPQIKSTDYFFPQMHSQELKEAKAIDIIYYTDFVTETSRANVFCIKNGIIRTPKESILEGITRKRLLTIKPSIIQGNISINDLYEADEVFITSSSKELMPVVQIDNQLIGNGKVGHIYQDLHAQFRAFCYTEN